VHTRADIVYGPLGNDEKIVFLQELREDPPLGLGSLLVIST
jgi:hypothetical protein